MWQTWQRSINSLVTHQVQQLQWVDIIIPSRNEKTEAQGGDHSCTMLLESSAVTTSDHFSRAQCKTHNHSDLAMSSQLPTFTYPYTYPQFRERTREQRVLPWPRRVGVIWRAYMRCLCGPWGLMWAGTARVERNWLPSHTGERARERVHVPRSAHTPGISGKGSLSVSHGPAQQYHLQGLSVSPGPEDLLEGKRGWQQQETGVGQNFLRAEEGVARDPPGGECIPQGCERAQPSSHNIKSQL